VRAGPAGSWLSSQYHWAAAGTWFAAAGTAFGDPLDAPGARAR